MYIPPGKRREQQKQSQSKDHQVDAKQNDSASTIKPTESKYAKHLPLQSKVSVDKEQGQPLSMPIKMQGSIDSDRWDRGLLLDCTDSKPVNSSTSSIHDSIQKKGTRSSIPPKKNDFGRNSYIFNSKTTARSTSNSNSSHSDEEDCSGNTRRTFSSLLKQSAHPNQSVKLSSDLSANTRLDRQQVDAATPSESDTGCKSELVKGDVVQHTKTSNATGLGRLTNDSGIEQLQGSLAKMSISTVPIERSTSAPVLEKTGTSGQGSWGRRLTSRASFQSQHQLPLDRTGSETRVLEVCGIPPFFRQSNIQRLMSESIKQNVHISVKMESETKAFVLFPTSTLACTAYHNTKNHPEVQVKPSIEYTIESPRAPTSGSLRPVTTDMTARRLIAGALGIQTPQKSKQGMAEDRRKLQEARDAKKRNQLDHKEKANQKTGWDL
ncbi:hypothetical protein BDV3_007267 [Batrachochytrium dendrobatidis]